jgi:methionyl-tRNA formyltransferase
VVIALGHTDGEGARRVRRTLSRSALLLGRPELSDPVLRHVLTSARPDVLLSWFWPKKIPADVLAIAPRGAFGVHPSLLPRHRGPDPTFWAILEGDTETGVTLHRLADEYDTGRIVAQQRVAITPEHSAWGLAKALDRPSLALLVEAAAALARGESLEGIAQDDALSSHAPQPSPEQLAIDWRQPFSVLSRLVRAARPYPGATMAVGERELEVLEVGRTRHALPRALQPADAVRTDEGVVVRCGDGGVVLTRVRDAEGKVFRGQSVSALFPPLTELPAPGKKAP